MNRADALEALSRERPLTEAEVDELWRAVRAERRTVHPCQTREAKRVRYQRCKDRINERKRWRWANDPDWRAQKRARDAAWRKRRAKRCSPA